MNICFCHGLVKFTPHDYDILYHLVMINSSLWKIHPWLGLARFVWSSPGAARWMRMPSWSLLRSSNRKATTSGAMEVMFASFCVYFCGLFKKVVFLLEISQFMQYKFVRCNYVYTYIHTYVRTYTHTYIHTYINTYIQTDRHTYRQTDIHTYIIIHT